MNYDTLIKNQFYPVYRNSNSKNKSRNNILIIIKGSEFMSKQSNQRYRKEVEKEQGTKTGSESSASTNTKNHQTQNKINREFNASSGSSDR